MKVFTRGERVVVASFVWDGDEVKAEPLDGWLVQMTDRTVTIASSPDWQYLEFDEDYFTATYALDDVVVTPFIATEVARYEERRHA